MKQCDCPSCMKVRDSVEAVLACLKETTDDMIQGLAVLDLAKALILQKTLTVVSTKPLKELNDYVR